MAQVERRDKKPEDEPKEGSNNITRRDFLVGSGAGLAGLVVGGVVGREVLGKPSGAPEAAGEPAAEPVAEPAAEAGAETAPAGWGMEHYPYPRGTAFIETVEMNCVGCGICEMACSMEHFGVINKDLARIQVRKYLLPLPKAVQTTCTHCQDEERECQLACPVKEGAAIYFDSETRTMVINEETCLGEKCDQCEVACPSGAIRRNIAVTPYPLVCDLCSEEGERTPSCVDVCPYNALRFRSNTPADNWRIHSDEKADLIARRLYPLPKTSMGTNWRV